MKKLYHSQKALLIDPRGRILLLRSSRPSASGHDWDLPGGMMEGAEEPLDCLAREVFEETGICVDTQNARVMYQHLIHGHEEIFHEKVLKTYYIVAIEQTDVRLSWEHVSHIWLDPRNRFPDNLSGSILEVLEAYRAQEGVTRADERIAGHSGYGLVQLIHGHGKGKTTSALGQAIRSWGAGKRVCIVYFDKGGEHYSERRALKRCDGIVFEVSGRDRIDPITGRFDFTLTQEDMNEAKRALKCVKKAMESGAYDLVVLDEVNSSVALGMITVQDVVRAVEGRKPGVEVILTGRNPAREIVEIAHLESEIRAGKHYFYSGVPAREGLDF